MQLKHLKSALILLKLPRVRCSHDFTVFLFSKSPISTLVVRARALVVNFELDCSGDQKETMMMMMMMMMISTERFVTCKYKMQREPWKRGML